MDNYQLQPFESSGSLTPGQLDSVRSDERVITKFGRRIAWAAFVTAFVVGGLWMAAQATNQDLPGLGGAKPVATNAASGYGFSTDLSNLNSDQLNAKLDGIKATGASWVRFDLSWDQVQAKGPASYDWSAPDAQVKAAELHGLKTVLDIDFTPTWARGACTNSKMCGPADPHAYGAFAAAVAAHYKPYGVEDYEIWNEPNISYRFHPDANPQLYTAMLKSAYTNIKHEDPNALVIAASTAPSATDGASYGPADWLNAMYGAGAQGSFDAISAHPYTYPVTPAQSNPADAWGQLQTMHQIMAAHGDGAKQIWITEFGAPTNGPNIAGDHVSEAVQAQTVTEAISIFHSYPWSGPLFWYDYQDAGSGTWNSENFYGLVRADGSFKPAYYAWKQAIAATP